MCRKSVILHKKPENGQKFKKPKSITHRSILKNSSKIQAVKAEIKKYCPQDKIIIVSQWRAMLDALESIIEKMGYRYVRIDGKQTLDDRYDCIREFDTDPECCVLLLSFHTSVEGMNMTCSNRMYFMEKWWNHAKMWQIEDRIHRIGQNRDVQITCFQMNKTIEDQISRLVEKKKQTGEMINGKRNIENNISIVKEIITLINRDDYK
jgi:SNF2 family DNA or RNA helicase